MSPYSYLAWCWLRENKQWAEENWGPLILRPVLMSRVIKSHETKGPAEIRPKREYLLRECLRIASIENIPFKCPDKLPFNNLIVARLGCIDKGQFEIVDLLFRLGWEEGQSLEDEDFLLSYLEGKGLEKSSISSWIDDKNSRIALKKNCSEAIEKGLFGVPSFLLIDGEDEELFWGRESISHLKLKIDNNDPLDQNDYCDFLSRIQI